MRMKLYHVGDINIEVLIRLGGFAAFFVVVVIGICEKCSFLGFRCIVVALSQYGHYINMYIFTCVSAWLPLAPSIGRFGPECDCGCHNLGGCY